MQNEPCVLCLRALPLIDSHFLPAGLYRRLRTPNEKNQNPILTSRVRAVQIGFQMAEPLLCSDCDGLFSKRGEAYVLPRIRQKSTFPFLDQLKVALEVYRSQEWNIYSGEAVGFDMEKIAYFGVSLLWRAAVHAWTMVDGKTTSVTLEDNYKEDLRRYLLGETGFPKNCFVVVTFATDWASQNACFVPNRIKEVPVTAFGLMTKGLYFRIFFGEDVPREMQQICCASGAGKLLFTRDCEDGLIETWRKLMENSRPVGNLAKSPPKRAA
jgi:hypothetical protein